MHCGDMRSTVGAFPRVEHSKGTAARQEVQTIAKPLAWVFCLEGVTGYEHTL